MNRRASLFIRIRAAKGVYIMVRTRTIKEAAVYFRDADPQTSLTETAIRTLLRTGAVPSIRVGRSTLCPWKLWKAILRAK